MMLLIQFGMALGLAALAAFAWRWRGMNENDVPGIMRPRWVRRGLCAILVALAAIVAGAGGLWSLLVAVPAFGAMCLGHGSYLPGGGPKIDNETTRHITKLWTAKLGEGDKVAGMALTGIAVTLVLGFLPGVAFWASFVGLVKAAAYWALHRFGVRNSTVVAEYVTGALTVGLIALA